MHISIERGALLKALERVRNVVEGRNTIPILSNVLMSIADGALTVTTTDLDIEATARAESSDFDFAPGQITAPMATLYDLVRKLPEGSTVLLKYDGDDPRLLVKAGRFKTNLPVLPAGDFPSFSAEGLPAAVEVASAALASLLDMSSFAMSTEETRYYLNGVHFHMMDGGEKIRAVATDGHRMAVADMVAPKGLHVEPVIVPRKTVKELRRMLDSGALVSVQMTKTKLRFTMADGAVLVSKTIDGAFPDYMRVLPKSNDKRATFDPAVMVSSVDRVATISAEKSRSAKFEFSDGMVKITVRNMEAGQAIEEVEVDYSDERFEIGLNARYLMDVLNRIKDGLAVMEMSDPVSPALITSETNPNVQFVVMPLRV